MIMRAIIMNNYSLNKATYFLSFHPSQGVPSSGHYTFHPPQERPPLINKDTFAVLDKT